MKVGFILLSSAARPIPSTRVAALNMFPLLDAMGVACEVLYAPEIGSEQPDLPLDAADIHARGIQVVCFQKVHGASALKLAAELRALGVGTLFLVCDVVDVDMCVATDITATVTGYLRSLYPLELQQKIVVVHDGIERPDVEKRANNDSNARTLNAVLVTSAHLTAVPVIGSPPAWLRITIVGPYAKGLAQRLREDRWTFQKMTTWRERRRFIGFLLNPRIRRVRWSPDGVYDELVKADVGIIPISHDAPNRADMASAPLWKRKSENRLTLKMAIGLPVVATPIPAYEPVVRNGVNGYLASTESAWMQALEALREPTRRQTVGRQARRDVLERFSMRAQAEQLRNAIVAAIHASEVVSK